MQRGGTPSWAKWIGNTAVILIVLIWLFPVYWIVATSLKKTGDIVNPVPSFLFFQPDARQLPHDFWPHVHVRRRRAQ